MQVRDLVDPDTTAAFLAIIPALRANIIRFGKTSLETEYEQLIIRANNRDPKVIWHEPTRQWVIVLYLDDKRMAFYTSKDLKDALQVQISQIVDGL